ncbi:MAG: hypothetical protein OEY14_13525, partial [Myxococcales bacterium]|nr:hypothetical protein [Myxococcales bacterium]
MTTYRRWIAPWMAAGLLIACGSDASSAPEGAGSRPSAEPAVNPTADEAPAVPAPPSPAPALPPLETRLDLMGLVELADVYAPSLQIDFGSPARLKYTNGSWRSGWGADGERGGETFTNFARMGKVYF